MAIRAWRVVRMSLKSISRACSDRPEVWMWYLSFWRALVGPVLEPHGDGPDAPGDPPQHRVLGIHAVTEEERQVGGELVHVHAPGEIGLHVGEAVRQGEGELGDGIRPRLGDVVAGDGHGVEVAHVVADEVFLHVRHHPQCELGGEDAGVLALVLLEDVRLHRAAHGGKHPLPDLLLLVLSGRAAVLALELLQLLVDGGVEETWPGSSARAR
ncbi:MAG: hypothetical protein KatS3mg123_3290 [Burkholderiales bacterium]|nr:MAG: hypothetical protein KatS3mg123_3290 [Burkholderiales bacterium]